MTRSYKRTLEDGSIQRVEFADDPGESIPQWTIDEVADKARREANGEIIHHPQPQKKKRSRR